MASTLATYYDFISRPLPAPRGVPLLEFYPNMWKWFVLMTIFFISINRLVPVICHAMWPKWWNSLSERKRFDLPAYVVSLFHHGLCMLIGWALIVDDFHELVDFSSPSGKYRIFEEVIVPWCSAYFIADSICYAVPELIMRGSVEFLIHHVLGLWMTYAVVASDVNFTRFFAHLLICETTGVLFGVAWILRAAGHTESILVKVLELLFSIGFIILRGGNLTVVFIHIFTHPESTAGLGWARFTLPLIGLMQWIWLYKIVTGLAGRLFKKSKDPKKAS